MDPKRAAQIKRFMDLRRENPEEARWVDVINKQVFRKNNFRNNWSCLNAPIRDEMIL